MLTLTDTALDAVRTITAAPEAPETTGVRIAPAETGTAGLELSVVAQPAGGDEVIDDAGARVYVEQQTAELLSEQTLDATVADGGVQFTLVPQASPDAPG